MFVQCNCTGHLLEVVKDEDFTYVYAWQRTKDKDSIWYRIKLAWQALTEGQYLAEEILLKPSDALKLSEYLK